MVLDENGRHTDEVAIARRVTRTFRTEANALARRSCVDRARIDGGDVAGLGQRRGHGGSEAPLQPVRRGAVARIFAPTRIGVRHVILHVEALADVAIDVENGVERAQQRDHRTGLRRVRLGVVAVEIDVTRVRIATLFSGPADMDEIVGAHLLVTVDIVDRHEDQIDMVEQIILSVQGDVAQQHQPGILAVDLAGVNASLDEHDRLFAAPLAGTNI